jgi:hypothetical protein
MSDLATMSYETALITLDRKFEQYPKLRGEIARMAAMSFNRRASKLRKKDTRSAEYIQTIETALGLLLVQHLEESRGVVQVAVEDKHIRNEYGSNRRSEFFNALVTCGFIVVVVVGKQNGPKTSYRVINADCDYLKPLLDLVKDDD